MPQLTVWTIYRHPHDYPGRWVMRAHEVFPTVGITRPHDVCFVASSLDEIRAKVPPGTCRVDRAPEDYPVIYECWLGQALAPSLN